MSKFDKINKIVSIYNNWLKFSLLGRSTLSNAEYEELAEYGKLPLHFDMYKAFSVIDKSFLEGLLKSEQAFGSTTKKPLGPNSAEPAQKDPASLPGLASPAQGMDKKDNAHVSNKSNEPKHRSNAEIGKPAGGGGGGHGDKKYIYLPKKDFPQPPEGASLIDDTGNSWKVEAGYGRQALAQQETVGQGGALNDDKSQSTKKQPTSKTEAVGMALKSEPIMSRMELDKSSVGCTKVTFASGASGVMKPDQRNIVYRYTNRVEKKPEDPTGWKYDAEDKSWSKQETVSMDITAPSFHATGAAGNQPFGRNVQREVSAHRVATLHGMSEVPVTVSRSDGGKSHSVQQWKEGYGEVSSIAKELGIQNNNKLSQLEALHKIVPPSKHADFDQKLMDYAVFDIVINNSDRHGHNYLVNKEGQVALIDHGLAFSNSMHGTRNALLHSTFHHHKPIQISESQQKRLKNLSFQDYKRGMPDMLDWEVGQTFLRNRYVLWLQENHGSIDRQKFSHTLSSNDGSYHGPGDDSSWSLTERSKQKEFEERGKAGLLPHQMFESWSKAYIDSVKADSAHRDYNDIKAIDELGVFMERGFPSHDGGEDGYRKAGKHKTYEASITPSFDIPDNVIHAMRSRKLARDGVASKTNDMLAKLNAGSSPSGAAETLPSPTSSANTVVS